jgi:ferric-dicitrate binding protein FerR (iron transport regulator)
MKKDSKENTNIDELKELLDGFIHGTVKIDSEIQMTSLDQKVSSKFESIREEFAARDRKLKRLYFLGFILSVITLTVSIFYIKSFYNGQIHYSTSEAQISQINVGGATIHLNSKTRISLSGEKDKQHKVYLENGEIYIDNPQSEYFEIVTDDQVIVFFNGSVNILTRDEYRKISSLDADVVVQDIVKQNKTTIAPNEQYRRYKGESSTKINAQAGNVGMFKNGFMYYDQDPLSFVLTDIATTYRLVITYQGKRPDDVLVSGLFSVSTDPLEVLRNILPPPYTATLKGENEIVIRESTNLKNDLD